MPLLPDFQTNTIWDHTCILDLYSDTWQCGRASSRLIENAVDRRGSPFGRKRRVGKNVTPRSEKETTHVQPTLLPKCPEFVEFLVRNGIDSMSLSRDSVIGVIRRVADVEAHTQREAEVVGA